MATPTKNILLDEQLCFALYTASKRYNHFYSEALAPFKLTYPQYITLLALWEKSPMTVRELGSHVNLDSGTLTPLLKRMQTQGWVERKRDTDDERQVNISLSQKAIDAKPEIFAHVNSCMDLLGLDEAKLTRFAKRLTLLPNTSKMPILKRSTILVKHSN
ncbi:MarR family winged helix-turn-helix transcriptional regulator [Lactiplantibacillus plantarum]